MKLLNFQEKGAGEAIVLLHGLLGSLDNLGMVTRGIESSLRVIAVDLPDHGQSYFSEQFSYAEYANAVLQLLDHLGIDRCHLVGHSMGGKVAMQLALNHPQRVTKLVVADIAPVAYPAHHTAIFAGLNNVDLATISNRNDADNALAKHISEAGVRQFLLKSLQQTEQGWQWRFNLPLLQRDYALISAGIDSSQTFEQPTLFIKGTESDYIQAEHRESIQRLFPNAKAQLMQGCGHWLHAEKPQQFNRILLNFIHP
ncbi:alpha/beta fold hydrolase [Neptunicella sp. SCSIO 80796]|uniref:alpha/beta fold hydrolase n=1 Tax=Neptunicella plasticusilytica TaxID=3117012 RepID=UPI003A4DAD97